MSDNKQIIKLYTELAQNPQKDFGWAKGLENAKVHGYKEKWIKTIPSQVWEFCAAVGNPFKYANIKKNDIVLDLGCGAGVDVLVASQLVGERGKVIGVDITPEMVALARKHAKLFNANNVTILESSFDAIDIEDESVDVVISNGAINLTSCKESVFAEIHRVLKEKGKIHFADMIDTSIDEGSCCSMEKSSCCAVEEDWANCVAGTMRESELIELIEKTGFENVQCTGHTHYKTSDTTQGATFQATKIASSTLREKHWDTVFQNSDYTQVLWHQQFPEKSLAYIKHYAHTHAKIIDVGCGASLLVDNLLQNKYTNITLLDTSKTSLDIVKKRIKSEGITFVCDDIINFITEEARFDIWHDRAVFHFLLSKKERQKYFDIVLHTLKNQAVAIISTFRVNGPIKCSGLNIVQYDAQRMEKELPPELELIKSEEYTHVTPKNSEQEYIYFVIRRRNR